MITLTRRASERIDKNGNPEHITYYAGELRINTSSGEPIFPHFIGCARLEKAENGTYVLSEEWAEKKAKFIAKGEPTRNIHEAEQRIYDAAIRGIGKQDFENRTPGRPVVETEREPAPVSPDSPRRSA